MIKAWSAGAAMVGAVVAALPTAAGVPPAKPYPPKPAVGSFASRNYALTFPAPARTFYCPLPDDWVGSDHGTVIFLERPRSCYGAGYSASDRGSEPQTPRLEIFYEFDTSDDGPEGRCRLGGRARLLRSSRRICETTDHGWLRLSVSAKYRSEGPSDLTVDMVTRRSRLERDLRVFRRFTASIATCKDTDSRLPADLATWGMGPPCPRGDWY